MNIITVDKANLATEHICCAISDKKGETCVSSKKAWLEQRFDEGLVFKKLDERGKVFIEYIPAENAWLPIDAEGYMHINCLWVSGRFKGQGISSRLLEECIGDAKQKGKKGLTILSSAKKEAFLADPRFLQYKGFRVADEAAPYFKLYHLPFAENASVPTFKPCAKAAEIPDKGLVIYYTNQCPHTDKYAPLVQQAAAEKGIDITLRKLESRQAAQNAPCAATTYAFFMDGKFVTQEILSEKKLEKLLQK